MTKSFIVFVPAQCWISDLETSSSVRLVDCNVHQFIVARSRMIWPVKVNQKFTACWAVRPDQSRAGRGAVQTDDERVIEAVEAVKGGIRGILLVEWLKP